MGLLDTIETNKQLENELDKIVMEELQDIYHRADTKAFAVRAKLHDSEKSKEFLAYSFYRLKNRNLQESLSNAMTTIRQLREETSKLYANKTTLLAIIGEMLGVISHNSTESQNNILMQTLKRELGDIDFARVKAFVRRLQ